MPASRPFPRRKCTLSTSFTLHSGLNKHARAIACVLVFVLALTPLAGGVGNAYADVRKADIVMGETVDARGLAVAQCPNIDAERAIVVDTDGTVYFERNADDAACIASVTKIMTGVVALDAVASGLTSLDSTITVSADAAAVGESSAGLQEGDTMTLKTALYALLVPSGNDAAIAIAESVGAALRSSGTASGDSDVKAFVAQMNATAQKLGCTNTVYENPHGLDFDQYNGNLHSTAADQAKVVAYAMTNQTFRSVVGGGSTTITVKRDGSSADVFLETTDGFFDINDDAIGVKTGYTEKAGASFAGAVNKDGQELYAIVLGSTSESQRFFDADELVEWAFEHRKSYQLANCDQNTQMNGASVPLVAQVAHDDWIDRTVPATFADPQSAVEVFDLNGNVSQSVQFNELHGSVKAGQIVGTVTFKQRNQVIATQDLVACKDVPAPNFFESIGIAFDRFMRGFSGEDKTATSQLLNTTPLIVDKTTSTQ